MHRTLTPTERTRLQRRPTRGSFETETIHAILDEGVVCHIAFTVEGHPFAIPTGYARSGDQIYIHGSPASRMLRTLGDGVDLCLTVTLVDGLVLARSAFHHSMNYRSVVVLGKARTVSDDREKVAALRCFTDHIVPGRWPDLRPVTDNEVRATTVLALPITEASAKVRTGPPIDAEEDYEWPVWAGVVPLHIRAGEPVPDDRVRPDAPGHIVFPRALAGGARPEDRPAR